MNIELWPMLFFPFLFKDTNMLHLKVSVCIWRRDQMKASKLLLKWVGVLVTFPLL